MWTYLMPLWWSLLIELICLLQVANAMVGSWAGPPAMMNIFHKMFGSHSCPMIIRQNNFSNFQHYFIQKVGRLFSLTIDWLFVILCVWVCYVHEWCQFQQYNFMFLCM